MIFQNRKQEMEFLFANNMLLYSENLKKPKDYTCPLKETRINIQIQN